MTVDEFRAKLRYRIEHPKCKRCGKEFYIPQPPQELYESWGIFAWTAFVKQYAKHHVGMNWKTSTEISYVESV